MYKQAEKAVFINHIKSGTISYQTQKTYLSLLDSVLPYLAELTDEQVQKFIDYKIKQGRSISYINKILQVIKLFARVNGRKITIPQLREKRKPQKTLTVHQINQIIAVKPPPNQYGVFFAICAYTGMRPCEVAALQAGDIDLAGRTITINLPDTSTKRHERQIPIMPILLPILTEYLDARDDERLFYTSKDQWGHVWRARCAKVGIKAPLYSLRRSFATQGLADGIHIEEMKELLGHSNINTTMIYYHHNMSILQKAIKKSQHNASITDAAETIKQAAAEFSEITNRYAANQNVVVTFHQTDSGVFAEIRKKN